MKSLLRKLSVLSILCTILMSCEKIPELTGTPLDISGQTNISSAERSRKLMSITYDPFIDKQISFILAGQLPSGAMMATSVPGSRICGYFANIACLGVLENPTAVNQTAVKNWMIWYMSKLNGTTNPVTLNSEIAGSVYDYYGSAEITNGTYDSVDSYAATFLQLAKRYAELSSANKIWLSGYSYQLAIVGNALMACMDNSSNNIPTDFTPDDNDWLTIDSKVLGAKYLMDNAEVNDGLKAMVWLQGNVITGGNPAYYSSVLTSNNNAFEGQFWRSTMYNWNDDGTTGATNSNWSVWYAQAVCQLYPAIHGIIAPNSPRAINLYTTFNANYPLWSTGTIYDPTSFPWAVIGYASAIMGDVSRTNAYLSYLGSFPGTTQPSKWYNLEAGFSILTAKLANNFPVNLAVGKTASASSNSSSALNSNEGNLTTRWSSSAANNQWWKVDLGATKSINKVIIKWEAAYETGYSIQTSTDNINFTNAFCYNYRGWGEKML